MFNLDDGLKKKKNRLLIKTDYGWAWLLSLDCVSLVGGYRLDTLGIWHHFFFEIDHKIISIFIFFLCFKECICHLLVSCLVGLCLLRKYVVRLVFHPNMTIAVSVDIKQQQRNNSKNQTTHSH